MSTRYTMSGAIPKGQAVNPKGSQSRYTRGAANDQNSARLEEFHSCVRGEMSGEEGSREDIQDAFSSAAKNCEK